VSASLPYPDDEYNLGASSNTEDDAMRALLLALAVAGSVAVPALAQNVALGAYPKLDLTGFSGDAGALPKAVNDIEAASGGRVAEIRYNNAGGAPSYDFVLVKGADVSFQRVSKSNGGTISLTGDTTPAWMLDWQARKDASLAQTAKVGLADAIRTAESARNGSPAVAAGIARSASNPTSDVHAYNVSILQAGEQRRVAVDSQSGEVIEDPSALAVW
jgi:hypothetical protein